VLQLPKTGNPAGNITAINNQNEIPFDIKRVYYLYDVPGGEARGGHAHRELHQLILASSGSFNVDITDGTSNRTLHLNRPYNALYMPPGIWRELNNFSSGSITLVLASEIYLKEDYIRDFQEYLSFKNLNPQ
jgi:hypothetical protein